MRVTPKVFSEARHAPKPFAGVSINIFIAARTPSCSARALEERLGQRGSGILPDDGGNASAKAALSFMWSSPRGCLAGVLVYCALEWILLPDGGRSQVFAHAVMCAGARCI